jgi:hypothetical protein
VYSLWVKCSLSPHPFKDAFILRALIWVHLSLSTLVAAAATKCNDWGEFVGFLFIDFCTFFARLLNFHVTCRKFRGAPVSNAVRLVHDVYNKGRVQPFGKLGMVTLRSFEVVIEEVTVTAVLLALIIAFPILSALPSSWVAKRQWFPRGEVNLLMAVAAMLSSFSAGYDCLSAFSRTEPASSPPCGACACSSLLRAEPGVCPPRHGQMLTLSGRTAESTARK